MQRECPGVGREQRAFELWLAVACAPPVVQRLSGLVAKAPSTHGRARLRGRCFPTVPAAAPVLVRSAPKARRLPGRALSDDSRGWPAGAGCGGSSSPSLSAARLSSMLMRNCASAPPSAAMCSSSSSQLADGNPAPRNARQVRSACRGPKPRQARKAAAASSATLCAAAAATVLPAGSCAARRITAAGCEEKRGGVDRRMAALGTAATAAAATAFLPYHSAMLPREAIRYSAASVLPPKGDPLLRHWRAAAAYPSVFSARPLAWLRDFCWSGDDFALPDRSAHPGRGGEGGEVGAGAGFLS